VALGALDAYTQYNWDVNNNINFLCGTNFNDCTYFGAYRKNRVGWTAGGGFEWAFASNWTAKAEFLYLDFGSFDYVAPFENTPFVSSDNRFTHIEAKEYVARVGINYLFHFGAPVAPVYARY
jgi:opacity protein-like surface antigen